MGSVIATTRWLLFLVVYGIGCAALGYFGEVIIQQLSKLFG